MIGSRVLESKCYKSFRSTVPRDKWIKWRVPRWSRGTGPEPRFWGLAGTTVFLKPGPDPKTRACGVGLTPLLLTDPEVKYITAASRGSEEPPPHPGSSRGWKCEGTPIGSSRGAQRTLVLLNYLPGRHKPCSEQLNVKEPDSEYDKGSLDS